ncbi:predicted protein [Arabidopsis lyrata subsp. lyrata]|uniref:Predicted protein n=1 Tax=Arabidopsis lyrata subsp. lyrata TaxID=81972 RepID=D7KYS0_ARALL|nr:predicted protein [Arabidopsis lyrata subsp. lyrata]
MNTRQNTILGTKVTGDSTVSSYQVVASGEEQVVASKEENAVASEDISKFTMWSGELGFGLTVYRNKNFRLLEKKFTSVTCLDSNINFIETLRKNWTSTRTYMVNLFVIFSRDSNNQKEERGTNNDRTYRSQHYKSNSGIH